jgi:signal transduction histidine kinase
MVFFQVVLLWAFAITLYIHFQRARTVGRADAALVGLVLLQVLLYLCFFLIPALTRWPAWQWFRELLGNVTDPRRDAIRRPHRVWWWLYWVASVAAVLGECRIEPAFGWGLIICFSQICILPMRRAAPASAVILLIYLFNRYGWDGLARWDVGSWFSELFSTVPFVVLLLFFGRIAATSGERGRLILELEAAKGELELARQREGELATLRERERLARELHDSLGHSLVTLTVQLEAAQRLQAADPARAAVVLTEMQKLTRSSMEDLRRSLANLRAAGLGERALAEALRALCAEAGGRLAATVDCQVDERAGTLPPAVAEVLWRVAQEGLTNSEKHAQARHVQVRLNVQAKAVVLQVSDNGIGVAPGAEEKAGHYGLRGLRERVEGLGGTFTVGAGVGNGAVIEARIPVMI